MNQQSKYKSFPDWRYGYTLGPPSVNNGGDYTIVNGSSTKDHHSNNAGNIPSFYKENVRNVDDETIQNNAVIITNNETSSNKMGNEIKDSANSQHINNMIPPNFYREQPNKSPNNEVIQGKHSVPAINKSPDKVPDNKIEIKGGDEIKDSKMQEEEISVEEILKGRNAIMYCNEQSKAIKRTILFEPLSESGPPHDKTFVWRGKMEVTYNNNINTNVGGDSKNQWIQTLCTDKTKKGAKTKAAEEMVKHIYSIINNTKMERKRTWWDSEYNRTLNRSLNQTKAPESHNFNSEYDSSLTLPNSSMDKLVEKDDDQEKIKRQKLGDSTHKAISNSEISPPNISPQNNPISKLYEHCKKLNLTDPMFELSNENVLEHFRNKDNLFKKTEFTMKCEVFGKVFYGKGIFKKRS